MSPRSSVYRTKPVVIHADISAASPRAQIHLNGTSAFEFPPTKQNDEHKVSNN